MAGVGTIAFTLAEWAKRLDPDGKVAKIVELLNQTNEILNDMLWVEGNLSTGHRTTVRTGLPSVTWRKLNYGVQPSKSTTKQVDDTCGMLEAYAEVDKSLADLNGNTAEFRLSEDRAFLEAMNQEMATGFFYHDTDIDPEKPLGLSPRYPYYDAPNVDTMSGTGADQTSIWLVVWGPNTVHGIFPKGSKAGIQHQDLGEVTLLDAEGGMYQGYRTHYKWDCGFVVRDWRYVARLCNIDTGSWPTLSNLTKAMVILKNKIPHLSMGRPVFYTGRTAKDMLDVAALTASNVQIQMSTDPFGMSVTSFQGIPIRRCDALLETESALSATP
jgi:hypothetical protein